MNKMRAVVQRLRNIWTRHGWRMFGPLVLYNVLYYARHWIRHRSFENPRSSVDEIPGVETQLVVNLSELRFSGYVGASAQPYQPIDEGQFRSAMEALPIRLSEYAFVDLGSGKGRTLFLAAQLGFQTITGVEFSEDLHQAAERNLAAALGKWPNVERIELVRGDAALYVPPHMPVVCYLYNPFGTNVMQKVIDVWVHAMSLHSLDVWFVYSNPTLLDMFNKVPTLKHFSTTKGTAVFRRVESIQT